MRDRSRMYNDAAAIASDKFPVLGRMLLRFFEERDGLSIAVSYIKCVWRSVVHVSAVCE